MNFHTQFTPRLALLSLLATPFAASISAPAQADEPLAPQAQTKPAVGGQTPAKVEDKANLGDATAIALGIKDVPDGTFFKASDYSTANLVDATDAIGGKAVTSANDWQPLVSIPLPPGAAFKVWVHHKGGPFAIKAKDGDHWTWDKPTKFEWRETDVFARTDFNGEKLVVGRDNGGAKADSVQIDAIVVTPAQKRELPPDKPDPNAVPQTIAAHVNWNETVGTMPREIWGANDQQAFVSPQGPTPGYQTLFSALSPALVRLHQGDFVSKLIDDDKRDWSEEKLKAAFQSARQLYGPARVMVCINALPWWIASGKPEQMTEADEDAFAAFCARLVSIARQNDFKVAGWEVPNEWDTAMERANRLPDLWRTWNKCATAMRNADPSAKIGGPALTWANPKWINGFLDACPSADFLTYHNYATGDIYEPNENVFASADTNIGSFAKSIHDILSQRKLSIPVYLTEINVKYTWDPYERRHQNSVGAAFLAMSAKNAAQNGLSGMMVWVQKGNPYGSLINGADQTQPAYDLYHMGTHDLYGTMASTYTDDPKALQLLAVTKADGHRAVLLINQTRGDISVPGAAQWIANAQIERITADGTIAPQPLTGTDVTLPGYSLALLSMK